MLYLVLAVTGGCWIVWRDRGLELERFLEPAQAGLDVLLGALGAALLLSLWALARGLFAHTEEIEDHFRELLGGLGRADRLSLAVISGLSEEIFFRGAMQAAWGWPISTVLFALAHLGPNRRFSLWTGFALLAGLVFAGLVVWRGSLLAAVVAHILVNAISLQRLDRDDGRNTPVESASE